MKIVFLAVLLWLPVMNCDWQLQQKGICFGAKGSSFGTFKVTKSGIIRKMKLVHESGNVNCRTQSNGRSFWGCNGQELATVITDTHNILLFPKSAVNKVWFTVPTYTSKSKELIYDTPVSKTIVEAGQTLRLWYTEDLKHHNQGDNSGKSCAAVYAVITQELTEKVDDAKKINEDQNKLIQGNIKVNEDQNKLIQGNTKVNEDQNKQITGNKNVNEDQKKQIQGNIKVNEDQNKQITGNKKVNEDQDKQIKGTIKVNEDQNKQITGNKKVNEDQDKQIKGNIKVNEDQNKQITGNKKVNEDQNKLITGNKKVLEDLKKQIEALSKLIDAERKINEKLQTGIEESRNEISLGLGIECDPDKAIYYPRDTTNNKMKQCYTFKETPYYLHFVGYGYYGTYGKNKMYYFISFETCVTRCEALRRNDILWNVMIFTWNAAPGPSCSCYRNARGFTPRSRELYYVFSS